MNSIKPERICLITDDVCSMPDRLAESLKIKIVKTKLFFPEAEKFPQKNLYQIIEEAKSYPKTSAPSPGEYLKAYKEGVEEFEKLLVITVSSKLSGTYNSAFQAKTLTNDPSKIFIFDSLNAVAGEGLLVVKAAELVKQGKGIEEILVILNSLREKTEIFGFLKTSHWAKKSGRVSSWQGNIAQFLRGIGIQPIIGIKKGRVKLTGFNIGTKDILGAAFRQIARQIKIHKKIIVGINYTNNISLAYKLKEKIEKDLKVKVIFVSLVSPVVGVGLGPETLVVGCMPYD